MPQEDQPGGGGPEGAAVALGSHLELLAQLLHQAAAGEGLQALCDPLLASSAHLSRGLEECRPPSWKHSPRPARREVVGASCSDASCGDARPASELTVSAMHSTVSTKRFDRQTSEVESSWNHHEWAEDQRVIQELRLGESYSDFESDVEEASRVFRCLRGVVGNARFEVFWAAVVMVNTCTMILEEEWTGIRSGHRIGVYQEYGSEKFNDQWWPSAHEVFFTIDCVFTLMFTVELILTCTYDIWNWYLGFKIHFRHPFWTNPWDWLDVVIVLSSNLALLGGVSNGPIPNARFFRIFRLVRLLRLLRLVRKVKSLDPLHLMTTALSGSATALVFSILLLVLIQTMFAMMLTQVLRYGWLSEGSSLTEDTQKELFRYFGTYTRSMVTMFELLLANWPHVCRFLMEEVHEAFGCLVVLYKLSVGFAVIGVINGVFIQETFSAAQNDEFIMVRKRLRQMQHYKQTITRLFRMGDRDRSGTLTRDELCFLLRKRAIRTWLEAMELRCSDPDMLFTLIAGDGNEVTIDQFVAGIGRLKGFARNIDVIAVLDILQQHQHTLIQGMRLSSRSNCQQTSPAQARGPVEEPAVLAQIPSS